MPIEDASRLAHVQCLPLPEGTIRVSDQHLHNNFTRDFSEQIAVNQEPVSQVRDPQQHISAAAAEPRCLACGSCAVYPLGLVYASSTETRASMSPQEVAHRRLNSWLADSNPPEKMTAWTGFTLGLLLWPPCVFLLLRMLYARATTGRFIEESLGLYLIAFGVGVIAWAGPALIRQREAHHYNSGSWLEEMRSWHAARVCFNCGSRQTRLDRLLSNS
jgi:hypothetical protein